MSQGSPPSTGEVYYFLKLVDRVSGGDQSLHRRIDGLSADERSAVAREVLDRVRDMELDDMGRYMVREAIRDSLRRIGK